MRGVRGPVLIALIVATAFILGRAGVLDWEAIHAQLEPIAGRWWAPLLLVALQAALYAFALPGSTFLVITPLLYSAAGATAIVVAGGVAGGVLGYLLSGSLSERWRKGVKEHATYRILERNSGFLALCAMRVFPGFPHSVINYGGGLLGLPLWSFVTAAAAGFAVKGYLYAVLVQGAVGAETLEDYVNLEAIWPLLVLAALLAIGHALRRRWSDDD